MLAVTLTVTAILTVTMMFEHSNGKKKTDEKKKINAGAI
jgi:hypothetical protein